MCCQGVIWISMTVVNVLSGCNLDQYDGCECVVRVWSGSVWRLWMCCQGVIWISMTVVNVLSGCNLDQNKPAADVTGHSGESVVLPCFCTELQAKPTYMDIYSTTHNKLWRNVPSWTERETHRSSQTVESNLSRKSVSTDIKPEQRWPGRISLLCLVSTRQHQTQCSRYIFLDVLQLCLLTYSVFI